MDTSVDTRHGIFVTTLKNQLLNAVLWLLMCTIVFGWVIERWEYGSILIGTIATIFYMSGIYSYSYEQPKLDMIIKKRYDLLMPLKIGGCSSLFIFLLAAPYFLLNSLIKSEAVAIYGLIVRFLNFPFVYFFHGHDGKSFNFLAVIIISIIPILVSYSAYYMSMKGKSLTKLHDNIIYEPREKK